MRNVCCSPGFGILNGVGYLLFRILCFAAARAFGLGIFRWDLL